MLPPSNENVNASGAAEIQALSDRKGEGAVHAPVVRGRNIRVERALLSFSRSPSVEPSKETGAHETEGTHARKLWERAPVVAQEVLVDTETHTTHRQRPRLDETKVKSEGDMHFRSTGRRPISNHNLPTGARSDWRPAEK
jgi:hypothetical protein